MNKIDVACVIDDDPIFVFGIKRIIKIIGFCDNLLVFENGKEALDNLKAIISEDQNVPDVILLDLNMPILDGWQFLDEFVKIPCKKKITIYIVSSSVDPEDVLRAKSYEEVCDYIVKPVTVATLKEVLHDFENAS